MNATTPKSVIWNLAGIAGLALGAVSTAYMFITALTAGIDSVILRSTINFILWAAKFAGCIFLMRFFMQRLVARNEGASNKDTLILGIIAALCSALIYSAASLANALWINPQDIDTVIQAIESGAAASRGMDANSMAILEKMMDYLPEITFFANLIYCFLFGTVLSAILSKNIPQRDPFAEFQPKDKEE